jgi:hypothetical protein
MRIKLYGSCCLVLLLLMGASLSTGCPTSRYVSKNGYFLGQQPGSTCALVNPEHGQHASSRQPVFWLRYGQYVRSLVRFGRIPTPGRYSRNHRSVYLFGSSIWAPIGLHNGWNWLILHYSGNWKTGGLFEAAN